MQKPAFLTNNMNHGVDNRFYALDAGEFRANLRIELLFLANNVQSQEPALFLTERSFVMSRRGI